MSAFEELHAPLPSTRVIQLEEKIWKLSDLERAPRAAEVREICEDLRRVVAEEVDEARSEGWADGQFEAGGL